MEKIIKKLEEEMEIVTINKCVLKEIIRASEDMYWILQEINSIKYLREDLKSIITSTLKKYENVYSKNY